MKPDHVITGLHFFLHVGMTAKILTCTVFGRGRWYLEDLNTLIVPEMGSWLPSRFDWDACPGLGRQADEVGEFYFMHRCVSTTRFIPP